jgi:hypothetical protein
VAEKWGITDNIDDHLARTIRNSDPEEYALALEMLNDTIGRGLGEEQFAVSVRLAQHLIVHGSESKITASEVYFHLFDRLRFAAEVNSTAGSQLSAILRLLDSVLLSEVAQISATQLVAVARLLESVSSDKVRRRTRDSATRKGIF